MVSPALLSVCKTYAASHAHRPVDAIQGRCLGSCLYIAQKASPARAQLVRWAIRGRNERFRDHWAVFLGKGWVFDPTWKQVGDEKGPFRTLASYPWNYTERTLVDAALLLELDPDPNAKEFLPPAILRKGSVTGFNKFVLCLLRDCAGAALLALLLVFWLA